MAEKKIFNLDFERQILGAMLLDNGCIDAVELALRPEFFYSAENRGVYRSIAEIYEKHKSCDLLMLAAKIGNASYVSSLTDGVTTSANVDYYTTQIKNMYLAREARRVYSEALNSVDGDNVMEVMNRTDDFTVRMAGQSSAGEEDTMQTLLVRAVNDIDERLKSGQQTRYLGPETGFEALDELMDGLPLGETTVIGARPSIGKTALMQALLLGVAKQGTPCSVFSLEMTSMSLIKRTLASETRTKPYFIQHGLVLSTRGGIQKFNATVEKLFGYDIRYYDSSKTDRFLDSIVARIRFDAKKGVKVFFIDHMGLVKHRQVAMKRYEQVHDIMSTLQTLAQTLNIAIVILCQLKRDSEGKIPTLDSLRESGDIEQDADNILFLHRERAKGNETTIPTSLILAKRREGACGTVNLTYFPQIVRFEETAKEKQN